MRTLSPEGYKVQAIVAPAFPDAVITKMEVGDWFEGENIELTPKNDPNDFPNWGSIMLKGNLVEIKIGDDFSIHPEQLERFQDECYRMACYRQKNPHVQLHAVWLIYNRVAFGDDMRQFLHYCFKYHIWGHIFVYNGQLIKFLKRLPRDSEYKEFEPFIKRSHEEPTELAKALRIPNGVSSDIAIAISNCQNLSELKQIKGILLKDGQFGKLYHKLYDYLENLKEFYERVFWLETGDAP